MNLDIDNTGYMFLLLIICFICISVSIYFYFQFKKIKLRHTILNSILDSYIIVDTNGNITTYCIDSLLQIAKSKFITKKITNSFMEIQNLLRILENIIAECNISSNLRNRETVVFNRLISINLQELLIEVRKQRLSNNSFIYIFRDITVINDLTERIAGYEKIIQNLMDYTQDGIIYFDKNLTVSSVNKSFLEWLHNFRLVNNTDKLVGKSIAQVFSFLPDKYSEEDNRYITDGHIKIEEKILHKEMDTVRLKIIKVPILNHITEDLEGLLVLIHIQTDISSNANSVDDKIKKEFENLKKTNEENLFFISSLVHDIRNPLLSILQYNKELRDSEIILTNDSIFKKISLIDTEIDFIRNLVEDTSRIVTATKKEPDFRPINISNMFQKNITKRLELNPNIKFNIVPNIIVFGDEKLLEIVVENLVSNSIKFSSKSQVIYLEMGCGQKTLKGDQKTIILFKDHGCGFDMKYANKLFHPFSRLHNNYEYQGTGLGLFIIKKIIDRHGGLIWVDSQKDVGTTFSMLLPGILSCHPNMEVGNGS